MICKTVRYNRALDELKNILTRYQLSDQQSREANMRLSRLRAAKQMAKRLDAEFGKKPEFLVFNNLLLDIQGSPVRIDHLVLSRWSACFIDTTHASQKININIEGQWSRVYGKGKEFDYFDSPLEQSRNNQTLLLDLLADTQPDQLTDTQHLIAIATDASIRGKGTKSVAQNICDTAQAPAQILDHHKTLRKDPTTRPAISQQQLNAYRKQIISADKSQPPMAEVSKFIESLVPVSSEQ
ncbi:MAG: NERD domain-containing protein [Phycisphaerales bacterium]|jgi:hypothetical protein|nr:NERD domain-containing protein [Phycisphaerales bacterium]